MVKTRTTLSIDTETMKKFKKYCEERGMKISAKVELYMKKELENQEA